MAVGDNLWRGETVRLTGISKDDVRVVSRWHNDAGFLRMFDAGAARPRSEAELSE